MDSNTIRTGRSQVGVIAFSVCAIVFLAQLGNRSDPVRIACSVFGAICLVGVVRSWRSGFIQLEDHAMKIRTLYRCRTFAAEDIAKVEARSILQITPRVMPVLTFRNGREYRLSEFFVQLKTYRASPEDNTVTKVVAEISEWLSAA